MKKLSYQPDSHTAYWILAFVLLYAQTAALLHTHQHDFHVASSQCVIYMAMERNIADITDIQPTNLNVSYFLIDVFQPINSVTALPISTTSSIRAPPLSQRYSDQV